MKTIDARSVYAGILYITSVTSTYTDVIYALLNWYIPYTQTGMLLVYDRELQSLVQMELLI